MQILFHISLIYLYITLNISYFIFYTLHILPLYIVHSTLLNRLHTLHSTQRMPRLLPPHSRWDGNLSKWCNNLFRESVSGNVHFRFIGWIRLSENIASLYGFEMYYILRVLIITSITSSNLIDSFYNYQNRTSLFQITVELVQCS